MSSIGVHDFQIPHDKVSPTRDMVIIRIPLPPRKIGSMIVPDMVRDLAQHNVQSGRIVRMGALAFAEKHDDGVKKVRVELADGSFRDPQLGDWAIIRPFAGTLMQGGKIQINSGVRYVSSFGDVIGVVAPEFMPDPGSLIWNDDEPAPPEAKAAADPFNFDGRKIKA